MLDDKCRVWGEPTLPQSEWSGLLEGLDPALTKALWLLLQEQQALDPPDQMDEELSSPLSTLAPPSSILGATCMGASTAASGGTGAAAVAAAAAAGPLQQQSSFYPPYISLGNCCGDNPLIQSLERGRPATSFSGLEIESAPASASPPPHQREPLEDPSNILTQQQSSAPSFPLITQASPRQPWEESEMNQIPGIQIENAAGVRPLRYGQRLPFPDWILAEFTSQPTPLQRAVWPLAIAERDVVGLSENGAGKTLAFLLPALAAVRHVGPRRGPNAPLHGPQVLILCASRESATATYREASRFCRRMQIQVCCVYGGVPKHRQTWDLETDPHVVVATPGRFLELLLCGSSSAANVVVLVLDEVDRMVSLGFSEEIRRVAELTERGSTKRQTILMSGLWNADVNALVADVCRTTPAVVVSNAASLPAGAAEQHVIRLSSSTSRVPQTARLLRRYMCGSSPVFPCALVFCETRRGCDAVERALRRTLSGRLRLGVVHSDKEQRQRSRTLEDFLAGRLQVLIATDVASRALDIEPVHLVLNLELPRTPDIYMQRLNRTRSLLVTLLAEEDTAKARLLRELCAAQRAEGRLPPREFITFARGSGNGNNKSGRTPRAAADV